MKRITGNRWWDAFIKLIILLIVVHIIFLILGLFWGNMIGWFDLLMVWAHWSSDWGNRIIGIVLLAVLYFIIYGWFTKEE